MCGKPACQACATKGPTGAFCGEECKTKHESFTNRAQTMDSKKGGDTMRQIVKLAVRTCIVVVVVGVVCYATYFLDLDFIPVLPDIGAKVAGILGL
jgi:hypothetical protein